jgi:quercetin dioxygenase-like cupin family protein
MTRRFCRAAFLGTLLSFGAYGIAVAQPAGSPATAAEEPIKRTVLSRQNLEGVEGKEMVVIMVELAPGAVVPKHYHPGPEFLYVLEGTLAHEPAGGPPRMLKTGEFAFDPDKGVHRISNPSTTARARVLGFLVLEKGQPLLFPVK